MGHVDYIHEWDHSGNEAGGYQEGTPIALQPNDAAPGGVSAVAQSVE